MTSPNNRKPWFSITADDCEWNYYRGSGSGGQHKNKTDSAVRCTHPPSGAVGTAEDERSQHLNKRLAFKRMATSDKFQAWLKTEIARKSGIEDEVEASVKRAMNPKNIITEVKENGVWKRTNEFSG